MTKQLILIRHAKSSWDDPFADDHARVINARGKASATAIGQWLGEQGYLPDVIISSDATRANQTAELILETLAPKPDLRLAAALYHAAPDTILDQLKGEQARSIAIVGHNPGIGIFAKTMSQSAPAHPRFNDYPTCATTVIEFHADEWRQLYPGKGLCVNFTVPRDLIGTTSQDID